MAIINNYTTSDGDVIYIESNVPVIGVTTLIGFIDDVSIVSGSVEYDKKYQISKNGVVWSEWKDLNVGNLQTEDIDLYDKIYIKYRYKQIGDGVLAVNDVVLEGGYDEEFLANQSANPYYFQDSIFSKYFNFNSIDVLRWYVNVTEKLYQGELNQYLKFDDGEGDPTDSILFWQTISKFFGFYVVLSRIYKDFYKNDDILSKYLSNRGLFVSPKNTLDELQLLMSRFNSEIYKRGTRNINNDKGDGYLYDGELRRYLTLTGDEEFTFNYFLPKHCGWWIDSASPLYRGLEDHLNANKLTKDKYLVTGNVIVDELSPNDVRLVVNGDFELSYDQSTIKNLINIDTRQAYILEFNISVTTNNCTLTTGVDCFDIDGQKITNGTVSIKTNTNTNIFIDSDIGRFANFEDKFFPVKCVVFSEDKPSPFIDDTTNIGVGWNLKYNYGEGVEKIYPYIKISGGAIIKDLYFRPLSTEYARGFINMNHFIQLDFSSPEHNNRIVTELLDNFYDPIHTNDDESILVNA